ncbi:MAG: BACON domain-containing protein [Blastocatellia bacterium]
MDFTSLSTPVFPGSTLYPDAVAGHRNLRGDDCRQQSALCRDGGSGTAQVRAPAGCNWTAMSSDWITFSPATGQGDGMVTFTLAANPFRSSRRGTIRCWHANRDD